MSDTSQNQVIYRVTRTPAGEQPTTLGYATGERKLITEYFNCDEFRSGTSTNLEEVDVLDITSEALGERKALVERRDSLRQELAGIEERLDIKD